ncbi:CDP-glucose 4,6-dehydratase [Desulfovibrio ferrophilus]|uniref:CDP-glucose 4,6-dehydratase n=1 Tax=Desulfovibrio ferrophilus TaxID=241368 RepID=A0A2Z6AZX0_9BACT|nr:CDP-glucose 4,6-dehydratase [Desulfovibrio ferrophilus]
MGECQARGAIKADAYNDVREDLIVTKQHRNRSFFNRLLREFRAIGCPLVRHSQHDMSILIWKTGQ